MIETIQWKRITEEQPKLNTRPEPGDKCARVLVWWFGEPVTVTYWGGENWEQDDCHSIPLEEAPFWAEIRGPAGQEPK